MDGASRSRLIRRVVAPHGDIRRDFCINPAVCRVARGYEHCLLPVPGTVRERRGGWKVLTADSSGYREAKRGEPNERAMVVQPWGGHGETLF